MTIDDLIEQEASKVYPNRGYEDELYCDLGEYKREVFIEGIKSDIARDYWKEIADKKKEYSLKAKVTISAYTKVKANSLEEAIKISESRTVEWAEYFNDQSDYCWTVGELDGEPLDITEDK